MSRTPLSRPTLLPGLPRIWRAPRTLQLGLDPARAMLLDLPDVQAAGLLDLLDGSRPERLALARAGSLGLRPTEATALLDTLYAAGLVVPARSLFPPAMPARLTSEAAALAFSGSAATPARTLRRRAAARVVVTGAGRLAPGVAVALAEAGAGHVHPDLTGTVTLHETPGGPLTEADIGEPRAEAVAAAMARSAPGTRTRPVRQGTACLVIQLGHGDPAAPAPAAGGLRHRPRLTATVREGSVSVGPLFLPHSGPCPECLARHRADRGAPWPQSPVAEAGKAVEPCGVATLLSAVARITHEALTFLDGGTPETLGAEIVITTPGRTRRRTWVPHPACGCGRRAGGLRPEGPVH
jgi:bacteriocin biosynthesis cyclodehydratase domain-containing protein